MIRRFSPRALASQVQAEAVYLAWKAGLRRYCLPCDVLYWGGNPRHRRHGCWRA
jgi:hypothetical protein